MANSSSRDNNDGHNTLTAPPQPCESCNSSPGIPCCRVEWSFLCSSCAPKVHAHNWIIPINPNPNPNNSYHFPYFFPYPYSYPIPNPNHSPDPNNNPNANAPVAAAAAAQTVVSSDEEGSGRMKSVMRYREKRKARNFEKTVRYENRKAHADLRLRVAGKFVKTRVNGNVNEGSGEENERNAGDLNLGVNTEEGNEDETA